MASKAGQLAGLEIRSEGPVLLLIFSGEWLLSLERPPFDLVHLAVAEVAGLSTLRLEVDGLTGWDTAFLTFVRRCRNLAEAKGLAFQMDELPVGVQNIIRLSFAVPKLKRYANKDRPDRLTQVGWEAIRVFAGVESYFAFLGQLILDFVAFATGRAQLRMRDFFFLLQQTGARALPIVCLLSFLTGFIIAFIGVIQLQKFAADIYVADLVGLATTRELGAVMAGVIMAGRTGAAFAAQIGSMRVNEEVDALTIFGISPIQFLVLPRVVALVLMMPLLCVCADVVAILGGMVVAVMISDVSVVQYFNEVEYAVGLSDLLGGIFKSGVFGVIVALAGCYRGLKCGQDATSVGLAATSAVVTSITWIVITDAIFAVLFHILGI